MSDFIDPQTGMIVTWTCGGCDRKLEKRFDIWDAGVEIACPWCDPHAGAVEGVVEARDVSD